MVFDYYIDSNDQCTIRGLTPNTKYFVIGVIEDWQGDMIKISSKKNIKTENVPSYVDLGGDIYWCSVNYKADRQTFEPSQFNTQDLFFSYTLPNPNDEIIPGDWRYPTKNELQYLCDNCIVTLIDFKDRYVRLTNNAGTHLYVPFTSRMPLYETLSGYKELALFPCDKASGINVHSGSALPGLCNSNLQEKVFFGEQLNGYSLRIRTNDYSDDFFHWSYLDGFVTPPVDRSGTSNRGVRFVFDK